MVRASIDDFSGRDLTAPTSIRVRRILSGLINFYLYEREQAAEVFDPAQEEQAKLDAEYLQLLEEEDRIDEEIAELQSVQSALPSHAHFVQGSARREPGQGRDGDQDQLADEGGTQAEEDRRFATARRIRDCARGAQDDAHQDGTLYLLLRLR